MATTIKRTRTRKPKPPQHPAITAIHAAHEDFRAWKHGDVGFCFDSDLKHDDRMIEAHPDQGFVWMVSPHGTHACRLGTADDCYADVALPWARAQIAMFLHSVCVECFAPEAIPEGWLRLYLWDGRTLTRHATLADLRRAVSEAMRSSAIVRLHERVVIARERLAALRSYESNTEHAERDLQTLTDEVDSILYSDWGAP